MAKLFNTLYIQATIRAAISEVTAYKTRTALAVAGIALAIATLVVSVGAIRGVFVAWEQYVKENGGLERLTIRYNGSPERRSLTPGLTMRDSNLVANVLSGAAVVAPEVRLSAAIRCVATGKQLRADVVGCMPSGLAMQRLTLKKGRFLTPYDVQRSKRVIVLSEDLVRRLEMVGDAVGRTLKINSEAFEIIGIYGRDDEVEDLPFNPRYLLSYAPFSTIARKLQYGDYINSIEVSMLQASGLSQAVMEIESALQYARNGVYDFRVLARRDEHAAYTRTAKSMNYCVGIISVVILGVGAIGIANVMLASLNERVREIGTRIAVGAAPGHIRGQFLVESAMVALVGGVIGGMAGVLLLPVAKACMPADLPGQPVLVYEALLIGLISSVIAGVCAGVYPAIMATRIDPAIAIKYE